MAADRLVRVDEKTRGKIEKIRGTYEPVGKTIERAIDFYLSQHPNPPGILMNPKQAQVLEEDYQ